MAVHPTIKSVLNILLPTMLPMAISALPFSAEEILTLSSGVEVPKPTIVRPMTSEETFSFLAIDAAPSVSPLAPKIISIKPIMRYSMFINAIREFYCVTKIK